MSFSLITLKLGLSSGSVAQQTLITYDDNLISGHYPRILLPLYLFIHGAGTVGRHGQDLAPLHPLHHLGVLGAAVGHLPAGEHLPAHHTIRPHVALGGEPGEV